MFFVRHSYDLNKFDAFVYVLFVEFVFVFSDLTAAYQRAVYIVFVKNIVPQ